MSEEMGFALIPAITEPPKILGPPTDVLVLRTSDSHVGAHNGSADPVICIPITSPKSPYPLTQTLQHNAVSSNESSLNYTYN